MHFHNSSINEIYIYSKKIPFCLPFRKADDTSSFLLSRACCRRLRLRPWCLESVASSTFDHLGFKKHNPISLLTGMFFIKNNFLNVKKRLFFLPQYNCSPSAVRLIQAKAALCFIGMNENQDHFLIDSLVLSWYRYALPWILKRCFYMPKERIFIKWEM